MSLVFNPYSLLNLRRKNRLTQEELGNRIGKNKATIVHWENGYKNPRKNNIITLAKEFNVSVDYFYEDKIPDGKLYGSISGNNSSNVQGNNNVISNTTDIELLKKDVEILKLQMELLKKDKKK